MITSNQPKMSGPGVPLPTKFWVDSHDTKPTNVKNGAWLKEIDTGKEFIYNEGTSSWDEQPSEGGGGTGGGGQQPWRIVAQANDKVVSLTVGEILAYYVAGYEIIITDIAHHDATEGSEAVDEYSNGKVLYIQHIDYDNPDPEQGEYPYCIATEGSYYYSYFGSSLDDYPERLEY